jgi:hypothetical protein
MGRGGGITEKKNYQCLPNNLPLKGLRLQKLGGPGLVDLEPRPPHCPYATPIASGTVQASQSASRI